MKTNEKICIKGFDCGKNCQHRLSIMGVHIGDIWTIEAIQPHGPITIIKRGLAVSIGRGLFDKILYEVVNENKKER